MQFISIATQSNTPAVPQVLRIGQYMFAQSEIQIESYPPGV